MSIDKALESEAIAAIEIMRSAPRGSDAWGDARSFLCKLLEADIKVWVKEHPPTVLGLTSYASDDPHRAVCLYSDNLLPAFSNNIISDLIYEMQPSFIRVAKNAIQSLKSKSKKSVADRVATRFPEYPELLKQIRATKKEWNADDARIKKSESFRVMGGLARLGSHAGSEYSRLVQKAQRMEESVLGKAITPYVRAKG
jgi:hypothetical protein